MNSKLSLLILHRVPFENVGYTSVIDHNFHDVTYVGLEEKIKLLPSDLRCERVIQKKNISLVETAIDYAITNNKSFDHVIAVSEYQLYDAAKIREALNISGANLKDVEKVRNKLVMKDIVSKAGILVPSFMSLNDMYSDMSRAVSTFTGSIILKPKDGASSENVKKYSSLKALENAIELKNVGIKDIDLDNEYSNYEVEEFIEGEILHMDGIIQHGKVSSLTVSRYLGTCLDYAEGRPFGSYQIKSTQQMLSWGQSVIDALEIRTGAFHLEAFESNGQLIFLEIGHRVGGANVVPTYALKTGINLHKAHIATQLNFEVIKQVVKNDNYYGWFIFPGHHYPKEYCEITNHEFFKQHSNTLEWFQLDSSQKLTPYITYQKREVPLAGIIKGNSPIEVKELMSELLRVVIIKNTTAEQSLVK